MNRPVREPYAGWCERRTVGFIAHGRLLDYAHDHSDGFRIARKLVINSSPFVVSFQ